jgi:hypothetical protein
MNDSDLITPEHTRNYHLYFDEYGANLYFDDVEGFILCDSSITDVVEYWPASSGSQLCTSTCCERLSIRAMLME